MFPKRGSGWPIRTVYISFLMWWYIPRLSHLSTLCWIGYESGALRSPRGRIERMGFRASVKSVQQAARPKLLSRATAVSLPDERRREALRRSYRPAKIKMLFIGEAAPASGKFFYHQDSGLYRVVRDAFHSIDASICDENFLSVFQSSGCYLVDACPRPVDRLAGQARRDICCGGESLLSRRIRNLQPAVIVSLLRSIHGNVERAALKAGWRGEVLNLPYPGRWIRHREIFLEMLVPRLRILLQAKW